MADGYLEKRMEDYLAGKLKPAHKKKPAVKKPASDSTETNNQSHS